VEVLNISCVDVGGEKEQWLFMSGGRLWDKCCWTFQRIIYKGRVASCMMTFRAWSQVRAACIVWSFSLSAGFPSAQVYDEGSKSWELWPSLLLHNHAQWSYFYVEFMQYKPYFVTVTCPLSSLVIVAAWSPFKFQLENVADINIIIRFWS
jgi:hypothetical protein